MSEFKALILGDVVGQPGIRALFYNLPTLKKKFSYDLLVVNGENASDGFGILPEQVDLMLKQGVDVITSGNHIWQKREILQTLKQEKRLLRPDNYPPGVEGSGHVVVEAKGQKVAVVNLMGRLRMGTTVDCPFRHLSKLLPKLRKETPLVLVDFHAEDVMEKEALGFHVDGQCSLLMGTHTHVQTADEKILPKGTAYISDIGMCGVAGSVIGTDPDLSVRRYKTQMPLKSQIVEGKECLYGIFVTLDVESGKALSIERVKFPQ
jgi:metallophosphoesterase (TIGR00282 family)